MIGVTGDRVIPRTAENAFDRRVFAAARRADKIVMVIGEDWDWSGEAASRTDISMPGVQTELMAELKKTGKPIVAVLMNGRPLVLERENKLADAILEAWYPGTMGGKAITQVLFGDYNPSGKLTMTFPLNLGQVPIYYYNKNTGRPIYLPNDKYKSKYIDSPNDPLFPFGYGLSYTTFEYSDITLSSNELSTKGEIIAKVTVKNTGNLDGEEVVQMYVRDLVGSVTRPVKELKGFQRVALKAGEAKTNELKLTTYDLAFYGRDLVKKAEKGDFNVWVGGHSNATLKGTFSVIE